MSSISVLVATYNRPNNIKNLLESLKLSSFLEFEILIIDQSSDEKTSECIQEYKKIFLLKYFKVNYKNKSRALNFGIEKSSTKIIAFTDDDCRVDKHWLKNVNQIFSRNIKVAGILGRTLPYQEEKHRDEICPCTIREMSWKMITKTGYHSNELGYGNNMSIRKSVFETLGGFREWLGPNSLSGAAEDAEMMLRILTGKGKLLYNPNVLVYHDSWLTPLQYQEKQLLYLRGETACYSFFAAKGYSFAHKVIHQQIYLLGLDSKTVVKSCLNLKSISLILFFWYILRMFNFVIGYLIGNIFAFFHK